MRSGSTRSRGARRGTTWPTRPGCSSCTRPPCGASRGRTPSPTSGTGATSPTTSAARSSCTATGRASSPGAWRTSCCTWAGIACRRPSSVSPTWRPWRARWTTPVSSTTTATRTPRASRTSSTCTTRTGSPGTACGRARAGGSTRPRSSRAGRARSGSGAARSRSTSASICGSRPARLILTRSSSATRPTPTSMAIATPPRQPRGATKWRLTALKGSAVAVRGTSSRAAACPTAPCTRRPSLPIARSAR